MTVGRPAALGLVTDLYEINMAQSYVLRDLTAPATFSCFVRRFPPDRAYLVSAGIEPLLDLLAEWRFSEAQVDYLRGRGYREQFCDWLREVRFDGEVRGVREGTIVYPDEPLIEITASLPVAQLVETLVLNELGFPSMVATKAARCVIAAEGRACVDFSLRRTHGLDAGMRVARATFIAGFAATSNVEAARVLDIPPSGTMAHSYIEAFRSELEAFRAFAADYGSDSVLLVDTYDTVQGVRLAAQVAKEMAGRGDRLAAVRLDSGDLAALARQARAILDEAELPSVEIFASGGLDEHRIAELVAAGAPIDGFGPGTAVGVSDDAPAADIVYKMVEFDGRPTLKLSSGKQTWAGQKQVFRSDEGDVLGLADEELPGRPLLESLWSAGKRLVSDDLATIRARVADEVARLPLGQLRLRDPEHSMPAPSRRLRRLQEEISARARGRAE